MAGYELPGFGMVQGLSSGVPGNPGAAGAPWAALGDLGRDLQGMGERAASILNGLQEADNEEMGNNVEIELNDLWAKFQENNLYNQDPKTWLAGYDKVLGEWESKHPKDKLSPAQRAIVGERYARFRSQTRNELLMQAAIAKLGQSKAATVNLMMQQENRGDYEGMRETNRRAHARGLYDEPTMKAKEMEIEQAESAAGVELLARENPAEAKRMLREKNGDGTWKHFPGLQQSRRNTLDGYADEMSRENAYQATEVFAAGRAEGGFNVPEDVDRAFPGESVSASLKQRMKEDIAREVTQAERAALKTPEMQNQMLGRLNAMIDQHRPEMADFDIEYYSMKQLADSLLDSPAKARALYRLEQKRKGQIEVWENKADQYRERLKTARESGVFGYGSRKQPVKDILRDGLLKDREKLLQLGLSPEQIETITAEADPLKQVGPFREAMKKRAGFMSPSLSEYDQAAFEAIAKGDAGFVEWPDAEETAKVERRSGEALAEFEGWFKNHPDATDEDFEKALQHIFTPDEQKQFDDTFFPSDELLPPIPR